MLNQFSRTQLLLGQDGMERLRNARVAVFGIGGVGGYTVEALARSGVGTLDLIDDDKVCLTNLNRQIFALRSTVGKFKVDVAAERIHDICPETVVHKHCTFFMPDTAAEFSSGDTRREATRKSEVVRIAAPPEGVTGVSLKTTAPSSQADALDDEAGPRTGPILAICLLSALLGVLLILRVRGQRLDREARYV